MKIVFVSITKYIITAFCKFSSVNYKIFFEIIFTESGARVLLALERQMIITFVKAVISNQYNLELGNPEKHFLDSITSKDVDVNSRAGL